jgi:hypothetical protein
LAGLTAVAVGSVAAAGMLAVLGVPPARWSATRSGPLGRRHGPVGGATDALAAQQPANRDLLSQLGGTALLVGYVAVRRLDLD